jgi:hypothetical protein
VTFRFGNKELSNQLMQWLYPLGLNSR